MKSRLSKVRRCTAIFTALLFLFSFIDITYIYADVLLEKEAQAYRVKGYESQERGDIDEAIAFYQKAVALDVKYAAPHNDLGILYEAKGWLDRAEGEYQNAVTIDPNYEEAHANLALLYERKGELEKAAFHWMRRYKLGKPGDPWTQEAEKRLGKLGLLDNPEVKQRAVRPLLEIERLSEQEDAGGWTRLGKKQDPKKNISTEKKLEKRTPAEKPEEKKAKKKLTAEPKKKKLAKKEQKGKTSEWTRLGYSSEKEKRASKSSARKGAIDKELQDSLRLAEQRLKQEKTKTSEPREKQVKTSAPSRSARSDYSKAKGQYDEGEYARALETIRLAKKQHPEDPGLLSLEQDVKNKMKEERIEDHYSEGIMRYRQEDYSSARQEFKAILDILPE